MKEEDIQGPGIYSDLCILFPLSWGKDVLGHFGLLSNFLYIEKRAEATGPHLYYYFSRASMRGLSGSFEGYISIAIN